MSDALLTGEVLAGASAFVSGFTPWVGMVAGVFLMAVLVAWTIALIGVYSSRGSGRSDSEGRNVVTGSVVGPVAASAGPALRGVAERLRSGAGEAEAEDYDAAHEVTHSWSGGKYVQGVSPETLPSGGRRQSGRSWNVN